MTVFLDYALLAACAVTIVLWAIGIWRDTRPRPPLPRGEDWKDLF